MDKLKSKPSYTDPKTGDKYWFKNNKFIEDPNKSTWGWGKLHRVNGPAIEWADGTKSWWLNGKLHRIDGPAMESASGYKGWHLNDKILSEEQFNAIPMDQRNNYGLKIPNKEAAHSSPTRANILDYIEKNKEIKIEIRFSYGEGMLEVYNITPIEVDYSAGVEEKVEYMRKLVEGVCKKSGWRYNREFNVYDTPSDNASTVVWIFRSQLVLLHDSRITYVRDSISQNAISTRFAIEVKVK